MSFGWSPSDIIKLIEICHFVVVNCRKGPTSAIQHVSALRDEILEFESLLRQFHHVLAGSGDIPCLELQGIEMTLKECRNVLLKYTKLGAPSPTGRTLASSGSREFLKKSQHAVKVGGEIARHMAFGEREIATLQDRVMHHKQSLTLYLTVIERQRTARIERLVQEMHAEAISKPQVYPLNRTSSIPLALDTYPASSSDRYQAILAAVEKQREFAMLERSKAVGGSEDEEWEGICDQLDLFYRRVLNSIERKANSSLQHGSGGWSSQVELNRALLTNNKVDCPPPRPKRTFTADSGFESMSPLAPVREENSDPYELERCSSPVTESTASTSVPSVFSFKLRTGSTWSTTESIDPLTVDTRIPSLKRPPYPVVHAEPDTPQILPEYYSPTTPTPTQQEPPTPTFPRRGTSSSDGSIPGSPSWRPLPMKGRVKILWNDNPSPISCTLEGGYRSDGRMHAIKAVDRKNSKRQLPVLKLSSSEKRPIPQIEPPGERDNVGRTFFVKSPTTKGGEEGVQYLFYDPDDHLEFQSLVYGQRLVLAVIVQKIASFRGRESDRQYLRIWEPPDKKTSRCLLYYATARSHPRYIELRDKQIVPDGTKDCGEKILKLKLRTEMEYLKITFLSQNDLHMFRSALFTKG
ncbi:hypothetical protein AJ80_08570 [Polytolypa hystricis UAMH7299]|uniref:Uncharacterized protein n=1 Tax=Polytolypa hystricis (strain UAMH7299) TaxID=1447883 RepID=A0A2B7X611_POLH7|nr:hypothetical protein AJ80_08570 [Polytolypa hystricis UAMH7299]